MDRASVVKVIRDFTDELARPVSARPPVVRADDPPTVLAALEAACKEHGISVQDYRAALHADPSLADLERQALSSTPVESPDPGPYDAISRESPSGQPGDLSKSRSVPRREAPGGS